MDEKLSGRAKEILDKLIYANVATTSNDGQPWNSPVFFAYDNDFNIFWGSHINSQHSKNIRESGKIFIVIYDSTVEAGEGEGVYIKADCSELQDLNEVKHAHSLLWSRRPTPYWKLEQVHGNTPVRLYKAIPEQVWMNNEGSKDGHYIDIRKELKL